MSTTIDKSKVLDEIGKRNTKTYNILKTVEELNELSAVLLQKVLKQEEVDEQEIYDELGDVEIRLAILRNHVYDPKRIEDRVLDKLRDFKKYLLEDKYPNI